MSDDIITIIHELATLSDNQNIQSIIEGARKVYDILQANVPLFKILEKVPYYSIVQEVHNGMLSLQLLAFDTTQDINLEISEEALYRVIEVAAELSTALTNSIESKTEVEYGMNADEKNLEYVNDASVCSDFTAVLLEQIIPHEGVALIADKTKNISQQSGLPCRVV